MPTSSLSGVIQNLLADVGPGGGGRGPTDGELLARFLRSRDHDALAALVRRHAAMVWGVCRRLLHKHHDAEDAFQATFLVLVRKAADVPGQAVANWLYGVARQTAVRLRASAAKRGRRETQVATMPEPQDTSQGSRARSQEIADLPGVLDEELGRLPDHYRGVIVLCELEGLTRSDAARQLGIPEGSVASRLARARAMLAKRLARRGVALAGGSVAAALSAGSAACAPPALVASTIEAAGLLAAGRAAGVSARVTALTEGVIKAMFVTRIKAALVVALMLGFLATGAALLPGRTAAGQAGKKPVAEKPVGPAAKPEKKDQDIVIAWGQEVGGLQAGLGFRPGEKRAYHLGETVTLVVRVRNVGKETVKFQYIRQFLDENPPTVTGADGKAVPQHRLDMLGFHVPVDVSLEPGKDVELESRLPLRYELRPADGGGKATTEEHPLFVGTGKVGLQYERVFGNSSAGNVELDPALSKLATGKLELEIQPAPPPKAEENQPAKTDQERMVGNWVIINDDSQRKGEFWVVTKDSILMNPQFSGLIVHQYYHRLDADKTPKQIDITVTKVNGPRVGVIKGIYSLDGDELRLSLAPMDKDRPTAFPEKPGPGEVLILHRRPPTMTKEEKLRLLIDKVLAAHGGEEKLNKLQFSMTVKHSNNETQHYFVRPPKDYRWETTHPDRTGKRICILLPNGRQFWTQEPNQEPKPLRYSGAELTMEFWLDHVKFFGPRQVLRLKDADHKVTLLDEVKVGERAAVGVEVTLTVPNKQFTPSLKMYFDKETHLLAKLEGNVACRQPVHYSDYKTFDGIPIARKEKDGYFDGVVTDFKVVDKFDDKLFEKP